MWLADIQRTGSSSVFSSTKYLEMFYLREKYFQFFALKKFLLFSFFPLFFSLLFKIFFLNSFVFVFVLFICYLFLLFRIRIYRPECTIYYNHDLKKGSKNNYNVQFKLVIQITVGIFFFFLL